MQSITSISRKSFVGERIYSVIYFQDQSIKLRKFTKLPQFHGDIVIFSNLQNLGKIEHVMHQGILNRFVRKKSHNVAMLLFSPAPLRTLLWEYDASPCTKQGAQGLGCDGKNSHQMFPTKHCPFLVLTFSYFSQKLFFLCHN